MIDITEIIIGLIGLLSLVVTAVIVPLIRSRLTAEQWDTLKDWTSTAVKAAEVIFSGAGRGEEKQKYVLQFVSKMCRDKGIKFSEESVRLALEQAWADMTDKGAA